MTKKEMVEKLASLGVEASEKEKADELREKLDDATRSPEAQELADKIEDRIQEKVTDLAEDLAEEILEVETEVTVTPAPEPPKEKGEPDVDPALGDKTPALVEWRRERWTETQFEEVYGGRKLK